MFSEKLKEECGVFGYFSPENNSQLGGLIYYGLFALQHRGQESCGMAVFSDGKTRIKKQMGLVSQSFPVSELKDMSGTCGIGHVRYSTAGGSDISNCQPLYAEVAKPYTDFIALAHNGNLTNAQSLKEELLLSGTTFHSSADSELILKLMAKAQTKTPEGDLKEALSKVRGAYSLVILLKDRLIAVRDPHGVRPLVVGVKDLDVVCASETCALDILQFKLLRELKPGEILTVTKDGMKSDFLTPSALHRHCIFELIYFSRPDSYHFGTNVHLFRKKTGAFLAGSESVRSDFVIAIPDSGVPAALGYAEKSETPYETGFTRNHYIGRSFIHPLQDQREMVVKVKLNPVFPVVNSHDLIVVDDSLVRGTTCRQIVKLLKDFGAKSVHLRFASPEVRYPCIYGIDTPKREKLLAANHDLKGITEFIGADSVKYLSLSDLKKCVQNPDDFCYACFTGEYF